jgi:transposase
MLKTQILEFDRRIMAWHRSNETSRRLDEIPGVGPALATALVAGVANPKAFRSARHFAAWVGLVPKQHSSGARTSSAASASRAIATCEACLRLERSPSSGTPRFTALGIVPGSLRC